MPSTPKVEPWNKGFQNRLAALGEKKPERKAAQIRALWPEILKGWSKACEAADLPGLHFHDLRRSAVRNLERAVVPRRVAMEITGHRTEAIYRRYDFVNPADLSRAGEKLSEYMK